MADSVGGVSHPLRTASASRASASIGLLVSLGGPISATTRSRSVTRTVSPEAASRTYSLNRLFNTFIPTDLMYGKVATRSNLVKSCTEGEPSPRPSPSGRGKKVGATLVVAWSLSVRGNPFYAFGCMPRSTSGVRSTTGRRFVPDVSLTEPGTRVN